MAPNRLLYRGRRGLWLFLAVGAALLLVGLTALLGLGAGTEQAHAAFAGKNGKIAVARLSGMDRDIYVMNPDGSDQTNLTNNPARDQWPAWSPDGKQIVFTSDRDTGAGFSLYLMSADGSNVRRLTSGQADTPTWTADGRIVFDRGSFCAPGTHLYIINADGSGERALTSGSAIECFSAASPSGDKLAFSRSTDGGMTFHLYTMRLNGTGLQRVTETAGFSDIFPNWSPNGKKLLFLRLDDPTQGLNVQDLYVVDVDGKGLRRLTNTPDQFEFSASWSPDGEQIVFSAAPVRGGLQVIYTMNADGSNKKQITKGSDSGAPDWQPLPLGA
jgi:TolB protein